MPDHVRGLYAIAVDERTVNGEGDPLRDFTVKIIIEDYAARRAAVGGTLRLPFTALGETYFFVMRGAHGQVTYLDGYTVPAQFSVAYPEDPRTARLFRGTMMDIDTRMLDTSGTLRMDIDIVFLD
jgi:hypothetical protein